MHINQVTDFDEGYNIDFFQMDEGFDEPEMNDSPCQVVLAEETKFFFGVSSSNQIAQAIGQFIPKLLAKSDELFFSVGLTFDSKGQAVLSVPGEKISTEFSLPDFSVKDRGFTFLLYPDQSGCFVLRLFSKFHTQE